METSSTRWKSAAGKGEKVGKSNRLKENERGARDLDSNKEVWEEIGKCEKQTWFAAAACLCA
jgi:hypothetical protein